MTGSGPHHEALRRLAERETNGATVSSLYLDVDGRRYPRWPDVVDRAEDLVRKTLSGERERGVRDDLQRITTFLRDEFDRRGSRGLALFACSAAGLWEPLALPQPVRDRVTVGPRPHLVPLEAMVESFEVFCVALVDREKARVFLVEAGHASEIADILDDVPGQHDQGGWAQARLQRHVEDHVQRHLKRVAGALLRFHERRPFEHLLVAGPDEVAAELERELHDYVRRTLRGRLSLSMTTSVDEVRDRTREVEEALEAERERAAVERLVSEVEGNTGRAVAGLDDTLLALEQGRAEVLVVAFGLEAPGIRCVNCGHLATGGARCAVCGGDVEEAPDLVEEAVESALRQRCRVETVEVAPALDRVGGIGALLRF